MLDLYAALRPVHILTTVLFLCVGAQWNSPQYISRAFLMGVKWVACSTGRVPLGWSEVIKYLLPKQ